MSEMYEELKISTYWWSNHSKIKVRLSEFKYGLDWVQECIWFPSTNRIMKSIEMFGVNQNIQGFVEMTMKTWQTNA